MQLNKYNVVIDAAAAASTDNIALIDQELHIGAALTSRQPVCLLLVGGGGIKKGTFKKTAATAEVLRIQTVTFVGTANNVTYTIYIEQSNPMTEEVVGQNIIYTTTVAGTVSPTIIADNFVLMINGNDRFNITATNVAGVMTLTALTGYPVFVVREITEPSAGDIVVATASPLGTIQMGFTPYYNLQRVGLVAGTGFNTYAGATLGYTQYTFEYYYTAIGNSSAWALKECNIFINLDDAQAGALVTAADAIFAQAAFNQESFQVA